MVFEKRIRCTPAGKHKVQNPGPTQVQVATDSGGRHKNHAPTELAKKWLANNSIKFAAAGTKTTRVPIPLPDPMNNDFVTARRALQASCPQGLVLRRVLRSRTSYSSYEWQAFYAWKNTFPDPSIFDLNAARARFQKYRAPNSVVGRITTCENGGSDRPQWVVCYRVAAHKSAILERALAVVRDFVPCLPTGEHGTNPIRRLPKAGAVLADRDKLMVSYKMMNGGDIVLKSLTQEVSGSLVPRKLHYDNVDVTCLLLGKTRCCRLDLAKIRSGATLSEIRVSGRKSCRVWLTPVIDAVQRFVKKRMDRREVTPQYSIAPVALEADAKLSLLASKLAETRTLDLVRNCIVSMDKGHDGACHEHRIGQKINVEVRYGQEETLALLRPTGIDAGNVVLAYLKFLGHEHDGDVCRRVREQLMQSFRLSR